MELSPRLQIQRSPDGTWYLTMTLRGFEDLGEVEDFIKWLKTVKVVVGRRQRTITETIQQEG